MSATTAPAGTAPAASQPKGRLPRILGVSFGIAVIVGDTIGSGRVNARGTPTPALLIGTLLPTVLAVSSSFETLIAICSILFAVVYLSGFVSLFVLRRREPNLPRPFRIWGHPGSNLGVLLVSLAFLVAALVADVNDTVFTVVLIGPACPVYFLFVRKRRIDGPTVLPS